MGIPVNPAVEKQQNNLRLTEVRGGTLIMGVEVVGENYRCNICGNEITVTKAGGGTLVCCGEDMEKTE